VRRRRAPVRTRVFPAGALAIGGFGGSHWGLRRTRLGYGFCLGVGRLGELFCRGAGAKGGMGWGMKFTRWVVSYRFLGVRNLCGESESEARHTELVRVGTRS